MVIPCSPITCRAFLISSACCRNSSLSDTSGTIISSSTFFFSPWTWQAASNIARHCILVTSGTNKPRRHRESPAWGSPRVFDLPGAGASASGRYRRARDPYRPRFGAFQRHLQLGQFARELLNICRNSCSGGSSSRIVTASRPSREDTN